MEHTVIMTEDGMAIHGLYRACERPKAAALLLHMMPATKESWDVFSSVLADAGIASLAIDERGHGESVIKDGVTIDYREFTEREQQDKRFDVEASAVWLAQKTGLAPASIIAVGASIGANLAIRYIYEHPECRATVALSPGIDYRGVVTSDAVAGLGSGQALLVVVSGEDATSAASVETLEKIETDGALTVIRLDEAGHGTTMFEHVPDLIARTVGWIDSIL